MNHFEIMQKIQKTNNEEKLIKMLDVWYSAWNGNCPRIKCHAYNDKHDERKYRVDNLFYEGDRKYYNLQGFKNALCRFIEQYIEERCDTDDEYEEESKWIGHIFKNTFIEKPSMETVVQGIPLLIIIRDSSKATKEQKRQALLLLDHINDNIFTFVDEHKRFYNFHRQSQYDNIISVIKMVTDKIDVTIPNVEINPQNIEESYQNIWEGIYKQLFISKEEMTKAFTLIYEYFENNLDEFDDVMPVMESFISQYIATEL